MAKITVTGSDFPSDDSYLEVRISGGDDNFYPIGNKTTDNVWNRPDSTTLTMTVRWRRLKGTVQWDGGSGSTETYSFDQSINDSTETNNFEYSFTFVTLVGRGFTFAYLTGSQKPGGKVIDKYTDGKDIQRVDSSNRKVCYIGSTRLAVWGVVAGDSLFTANLNGIPLSPRFQSYYIHTGPAPAAMESPTEPVGEPSLGHVVAGRDGTVYLIRGDSLFRYRHLGFTDGSSDWAAREEISPSWGGATATVASDAGVLYRIMPDGKLYWYQDLGHAGSGAGWANEGIGLLIGTGWEQYTRVMAGDDGVLYGITSAGEVHWFRHDPHTTLAQTGEPNWRHGGAGILVKRGWNTTNWSGVSSNGVIYSRRGNGGVYWDRHTGFADGSLEWETGQQVGEGWGSFQALTTSNDGVIYAVHPSGILSWYCHDGIADATRQWRSVEEVGQGWGA